MDLAEKISQKCTFLISSTLNKSDEELEQIQYGLHVLFLNIVKVFILFLVAYILGILKYTTIAFLSFASVRRFAGGIHCDSSINCNVMNFIVFLGSTYLSIYFPLNNILKNLYFIIVITLFYLYAPADTSNKPLVSKSLRKKLKINSIIVVFIIYFITLFISNNIYEGLIIYPILIESILITPIIYKLSRKEYRNYEKVKF